MDSEPGRHRCFHGSRDAWHETAREKASGLPARRGAARIAAALAVFAAGLAVRTLAGAQTTANATGVTSTITNGPDHTLSVHIDSIWLDIPHRDVERFQVGFAAGSHRQVTVTCTDEDTAAPPDPAGSPQITATKSDLQPPSGPCPCAGAVDEFRLGFRYGDRGSRRAWFGHPNR